MESSSGLTKDLQSKQMKRTPQDYMKVNYLNTEPAGHILGLEGYAPLSLTIKGGAVFTHVWKIA